MRWRTLVVWLHSLAGGEAVSAWKVVVWRRFAPKVGSGCAVLLTLFQSRFIGEWCPWGTGWCCCMFWPLPSIEYINGHFRPHPCSRHDWTREVRYHTSRMSFMWFTRSFVLLHPCNCSKFSSSLTLQHISVYSVIGHSEGITLLFNSTRLLTLGSYHPSLYWVDNCLAKHSTLSAVLSILHKLKKNTLNV